MWPFKKQQTSIEQLVDSRKLHDIFRPYYLNDRKVNEYFVSYFGDLVSYSRSHGREISVASGGGIAGKIGVLLGELEADAKVELARSRSTVAQYDYSMGLLSRFNILLQFWTSNDRLRPVASESASAPHSLVYSHGGFAFCDDIDAHDDVPLTAVQLKSILGQKAFEEENEKQRHLMLRFQTTPAAISLLSSSFVTGVGWRYLPFAMGKEAYFLETTIGLRDGVLFIDPIAVGAIVSH